MRRRGLTLIELMVTIGILVVIVAALGTAFNVAVRTEMDLGGSRYRMDAKMRFEDKITEFLRSAYLTEEETNTYFYGQIAGSSSIGSGGADQIIFTAIGLRPNAAAVNSEELDFQTRNDRFGPVGGVTEVSISSLPVGSPPNNLEGVFLRTQNPADLDYEQGGYEQLLSSDVSSISFEFFDGTDWQLDWSTDTERVLPQAVRVTYQFQDEDELSTFVVRLDTVQPQSTMQSTASTGATPAPAARSGGNP